MTTALRSPAAAAKLDALSAQQAAAIGCVQACQQLAADLYSAGQSLELADALRAVGYMPLLEAGRIVVQFCTQTIPASATQPEERPALLENATLILALQAAAMGGAVHHAQLHGISRPFAAQLVSPAAMTAWLSAALALSKALVKLPPGWLSCFMREITQRKTALYPMVARCQLTLRTFLCFSCSWREKTSLRLCAM